MLQHTVGKQRKKKKEEKKKKVRTNKIK